MDIEDNAYFIMENEHVKFEPCHRDDHSKIINFVCYLSEIILFTLIIFEFPWINKDFSLWKIKNVRISCDDQDTFNYDLVEKSCEMLIAIRCMCLISFILISVYIFSFCFKSRKLWIIYLSINMLIDVLVMILFTIFYGDIDSNINKSVSAGIGFMFWIIFSTEFFIRNIIYVYFTNNLVRNHNIQTLYQ